MLNIQIFGSVVTRVQQNPMLSMSMIVLEILEVRIFTPVKQVLGSLFKNTFTTFYTYYILHLLLHCSLFFLVSGFIFLPLCKSRFFHLPFTSLLVHLN